MWEQKSSTKAGQILCTFQTNDEKFLLDIHVYIADRANVLALMNEPGLNMRIWSCAMFNREEIHASECLWSKQYVKAHSYINAPLLCTVWWFNPWYCS